MRARRRAQAGYTLVILIVAVTVLNILVAAMLPLWSTAIKREKEEELVFRGFQYAEAIRVFHQRFQRYPNRLQELLEVKPRSIRQLWKDPMTEDGKWGLIFQNQPSGNLINKGGPGGQPPDPSGRQKPGEDEEPGGDEGPQLGVRKGEAVQIGPIIGVRSKSGEKSMLVFFGRERYDEWQFTETILLGGPVPAGGLGRDVGVPQATGGLQFSTRWLGRPMLGFNQQPGGGALQDGTLPDGTRPNGRPGNPPRQPSGPRRPGQGNQSRGLP
jgi:type II secretory pathway pseudopilin PulG